MKKTYRLICIADSFSSNNPEMSDLDTSPDYLHIHIIEASQLNNIEEFNKKIEQGKDDKTLFRFGIPLELNAKNRSEKVNAAKVKEYGNVGIGSASRGLEIANQYVGGGEAFLFDKKNTRTTKGNAVFDVDDNETYWAFDVANFDGAKKINVLDLEIKGRNKLMEFLRKESDEKPFIAVFDAEFQGNFFTRSNGIFPEDKTKVLNSDQTLFEKNIKGGHLVGGSKNDGDIKSLKEKFSEDEAKKMDFVLKIKSDILLKPIEELKIVKSSGEFRKPRTKMEVESAIKIIQNFWRNHNHK